MWFLKGVWLINVGGGKLAEGSHESPEHNHVFLFLG